MVMNHLSKALFTPLLAIAFLTSCSIDQREPKEGKLQVGNTASLWRIFHHEPQLKIQTENGEPIAKAQVLVGSAQNVPIQENFLSADENGEFAAPSGWTSPLPVTISAPGFLRATYLMQTAHGQVFVLHRLPTQKTYEVTGQTPGIEVEEGNENADFSVVLPALNRQDLLHFDLDMVLSPQNDILNILGKKVKVPSNVTFPRQQHHYYFSVTLDKPIYRTYFSHPGQEKLVALHGQFPFEKVVDEIRDGAKFYDLINDFSILKAGMKDVQVTLPSQHVDIDVNRFHFSQTRSLRSGHVGPGEALLGLAVADIDGNLLPTDVKYLTIGGVDSLHILPDSKMQIVSVLKRKTEMEGTGADRLSAVILPFSDQVQPEHLPLMENPRVMSPTLVQIQNVAPTKDVLPIATYALLSTVSSGVMYFSVVDEKKRAVLSPIWEVYGPGWSQTVEIPAWPGESPIGGRKMRWSVALLGGSNQPTVDLGPAVVQAVTHVTNSSTDF